MTNGKEYLGEIFNDTPYICRVFLRNAVSLDVVYEYGRKIVFKRIALWLYLQNLALKLLVFDISYMKVLSPRILMAIMSPLIFMAKNGFSLFPKAGSFPPKNVLVQFSERISPALTIGTTTTSEPAITRPMPVCNDIFSEHIKRFQLIRDLHGEHKLLNQKNSVSQSAVSSRKKCCHIWSP
uniref:Uncharacterized protein n=1 Tax=Ditylenchus dipsaci TaxID=166011 RepID=A0A915CWB2_9BILA